MSKEKTAIKKVLVIDDAKFEDLFSKTSVPGLVNLDKISELRESLKAAGRILDLDESIEERAARCADSDFVNNNHRDRPHTSHTHAYIQGCRDQQIISSSKSKEEAKKQIESLKEAINDAMKIYYEAGFTNTADKVRQNIFKSIDKLYSK